MANNRLGKVTYIVQKRTFGGCEFSVHICMLINIIVGGKEVEDREGDRITKS